MADISKFYPSLLARDKILISANPCLKLPTHSGFHDLFLNYSVVFKNDFDKFIDKFSRDVMYKIIHEILPVNILMFKYNISKTYKCVYCHEVETLRHLFYERTFNSQLLLLIKNWIFALSNGIFCLNLKKYCTSRY